MPNLSAMQHRALMAAIVLLGVALAVAAGTLLDRERTMQQLSKEQVYWSVAQAEIELYRFVTALEAYGRGEPGIAHDDVARRFDIFWSRMALFEGGDIAQRVLSFEGAPEAVRAARDIMTAEEDAVLAVRAEDDAEIGVAVTHRASHACADGRVVDRLGRMRPLVVDDMTAAGQHGDQMLLEVVAGVVGSDRDACHCRESVGASGRAMARLDETSG